MTSPLESLAAAAVQAPSGDNTQPWRLEIAPAAGRILLYVDETRDPSPMNSGQRMARIAVGAALENVLRAARTAGWLAEQEPASGLALASVRLHPAKGANMPADALLAARVTNRRIYDGRPVAASVVAQLEREAPLVDGVQTHWLVDPGRVRALAALIGQADALMFGEPTMRRAFLGKVRFDVAPDTRVEHGLPLAALELSAADRLALPALARIPNWLLRCSGAVRVFAAKARRLVESAAGLCLVVAPNSAASTDLLVGQDMQRAWLALTAQGLAVQPMMSLPVLENAWEHGTPDLVTSLGRARLTSLRDAFRSLVPELGAGRPAFLMRFGYAPPPSGRTGRLPLSSVVSNRELAATEY
jgi:nitroreductase